MHSVINPISYLFISELISRNYSKLKRLEERSQYSLSPSVFDWKGTRALRRPVFGKRDEFMSQLAPRFEYTVSTDIRAFYHSIYTHALPWAIHGKKAAKAKRGLDLLGNELDLLVRNAQGGQTIGLPVGPDTSRILAEVLVSSVDVEMRRHLRIGHGDASRFVDDYTIGCNSVAEGQRIVAEIRRAVTAFELDIGNEKTIIQPTNHLTYVGWQEYLHSFLPKDQEDDLSGDVIKPPRSEFDRFFYVVHDMAKRHPNLNVERFAMQISRKAFGNSDEWRFIQDHMVSSYRRNSTLIEGLVETIILRHEAHGDLEIDALTDFVSSRLPSLAAQQRTGEIIWLLYMACKVRLSLRASVIENLLRIPNALVNVMVCQFAQIGLVNGRFSLASLQTACSQEGLRSEMWLFAYEAARNGWSAGGHSYCSDDEYYGPLFSSNVSLFNIENGPKNLKDVLRLRARENTLTKWQMSHETGFDFDEEDDILDDEDKSDDENFYV